MDLLPKSVVGHVTGNWACCSSQSGSSKSRLVRQRPELTDVLSMGFSTPLIDGRSCYCKRLGANIVADSTVCSHSKRSAQAPFAKNVGAL